MDCRSLGQVQHPALQHGGIRSLPHLAAECIQFEYQMSFTGPSDGRVAGHIPDGIQRDGKDRRPAAESRCGESRLDPGVSGSDHRHIIGWKCKHNVLLIRIIFPHRNGQRPR